MAESMESTKDSFIDSIKKIFKEYCSGCLNSQKRNKGTPYEDTVPRSDLDKDHDQPAPPPRYPLPKDSHPQETEIDPEEPSLPPVPGPYKPQEKGNNKVHSKLDEFFESFSSASNYEDVHKEILKWLEALHYHPKLHDNFLKFCLDMKRIEDLKMLSEALQEMATALSQDESLPKIQDKKIGDIINELSADPTIKLDQLESLIFVCEGFRTFPKHVVQACINPKELPPLKKQKLIEIILSIPYGVDQRTFTGSESSSFMDPQLQGIMSRIGFKKEKLMDNLVWKQGDEDEDKLATTLILLEGCQKKYSSD